MSIVQARRTGLGGCLAKHLYNQTKKKQPECIDIITKTGMAKESVENIPVVCVRACVRARVCVCCVRLSDSE